jgi:glycosyltransferase involved in cell wall biosynthesis
MAGKKTAQTIDVSVVVCTLNEEKNIVNCLNALRAQKFSGTYEIIVADGPSTDRTRILAKPLADKVVTEEKKGIAFERQAGAKVAEGKIIAFTDCDSKTPEGWVQRIYDTFTNDSELSMIYGPVFYSDVSEQEQYLSTLFMPKFLRLMSILRMHNPIGSNIAIRREIFEKIEGFNTDYITCEDLDLGKRASKHGPLKYVKHLHQFVSARRVRKWGYLKYVGFHLYNGVRYHLTGNASKRYEDVRE